MSGPPPPILILSHLDWDENLFQRPQHLASEFARRGYHVIFAAFIGYQRCQAADSLSFKSPHGVHVLRLPYAVEATRWAGLRRLHSAFQLRRLLKNHNIQRPMLWIYHPSLLALAHGIPERLMIYDIMDRFAAFDRSDSGAIYDAEMRTLASADVIFAGGRSLAASAVESLKELERPRENLVKCYPSAVDLEHFYKATDADTPIDPELEKLSKPILGYFGAVDERIDYDLLTKLAAALPNASIALAGPVLVSPPADLPTNLHLIGPRPYAKLPGVLKAFNVALIPFKINELTRFVSPTKTPEYLAGGKAVVSTALPDVIADYAEIVSIGNSAEEFIAAVKNYIQHPPNSKTLQCEVVVVSRTWSQLAEAMIADITAMVNKSQP